MLTVCFLSNPSDRSKQIVSLSMADLPDNLVSSVLSLQFVFDCFFLGGGGIQLIATIIQRGHDCGQLSSGGRLQQDIFDSKKILNVARRLFMTAPQSSTSDRCCVVSFFKDGTWKNVRV